MFLPMHVRTLVRKDACFFGRVFVCVNHVYMGKCIHVCEYIMRTYVYIYIHYIYMYVYIIIHMHTCIFIYTYIHVY